MRHEPQIILNSLKPMVFGIPHFKTTTLNSCFMLFSQQNMVVFAALGGLCTDGSQQPHHSSGFDHQNKMWTIQWREKGKRRERERAGKNTHGNYVCIYIITIYTLCVHRMKTDTYKAQKLPKKTNHPAKYKHQAHIYFDCPKLAIKWYQVRTN